MNKNKLAELLKILEEHGLTKEHALELLTSDVDGSIRFSFVDPERMNRLSFPEIVFAQDKADHEVLSIAQELYSRAGSVIVSRVSTEISNILLKHISDGVYHERARIFSAGNFPDKHRDNESVVAIISAGTSDLHASEEAAVILELLHVRIERIYDIGVAGIHRLEKALPKLMKSSVCVVFAGMDGALPSVIAGLFPGPVIAIPTSTGYGAAFGGISALLAMLNSCSPGVMVLNIDNGVGAAAAAVRVIRKITE